MASQDRLRDFHPTIIVSAKNRRTGEHKTVVGAAFSKAPKYPGSITEALQHAIAQIEAEEGPWEVEALSWPLSVYKDIQGRAVNGKGGRPESVLLGKIGRKDLLPGLGHKSTSRKRTA